MTPLFEWRMYWCDWLLIKPKVSSVRAPSSESRDQGSLIILKEGLQLGGPWATPGPHTEEYGFVYKFHKFLKINCPHLKNKICIKIQNADLHWKLWAGISVGQRLPGVNWELPVWTSRCFPVSDSPAGHLLSRAVLSPEGTGGCVMMEHFLMNKRSVLVHLCQLCYLCFMGLFWLLAAMQVSPFSPVSPWAPNSMPRVTPGWHPFVF